MGLHCCAGFSLVAARRGHSLVVVCRLLLEVASLAAECGFLELTGFRGCGSQALGHSFSRCGTRASLLRGMRDLPGPGTELLSPALAGRFFSFEPAGKPSTLI